MNIGFEGHPFASKTTAHAAPSHTAASDDCGSRQPKASRYDAGRLPERILRAIALVYESEGFRALHITNRQVLATLVRFSLNQKDPSSLAVIKKATIARHLAVSEATVYRALGALEDAGLIEREPQQRTRAHLEVVGRIAFTVKLLQSIGIAGRQLAVTGSHDAQARADEALSDSACLALVSGVNNPKQSSTKKHPGRGAFVQIDGRAIPIDLAPLVRNQELKASALFLLMRLAREAGHRLSDVVSATCHALERLRGRELFTYIKSLLEKPVDYGHVVRTTKGEESEKRTAEARAALEREQVTQLVERYRGRRVRAADGSILEVDSASIVITDAYGRRSSLGHGQALSWLIEMDRTAAGLSPALAPPAPAEWISDSGRSALSRLRTLVGMRASSRVGSPG